MDNLGERKENFFLRGNLRGEIYWDRKKNNSNRIIDKVFIRVNTEENLYRIFIDTTRVYSRIFTIR